MNLGDPSPSGDRDKIAAALGVLRAAGQLREDPTRDWVIKQLAGGWSRHTYLLESTGQNPPLQFVVRVKPPGSLLDTDLVREYTTYEQLASVGVNVPTARGVDPNQQNPFGGAYFVMDYVPGDAPVVWQRHDRAMLESNWRRGGSLARDLVESLTAIHNVSLQDFGFLGPAKGFVEVVEEWRETYERQSLVRDPVVEEAFAWVLSREPDDVEPGLVHGDFRIGNAMVHQDRISGIVDWELAYIGDRRFDLAYSSLDYLAGKFLGPGSDLLCAVADREWFIGEYERRTASSVDREVLRTYSALGVLTLIAVQHTGIRMYSDGKTEDVRMAWSQYAIPGLRQDLTRIMRW